MAKIRVLVIDDSVVIRRLVSDALSADPEIEVAGSASDGKIGLARIPQVNPDVVTLDIEMPVMNGLETVAAIRRSHPRLPVIMFSTLTERGASATLDALSLGANDYVTKPANVGSVNVAVQRIRDELVPKIKALCRRPGAGPAPVARVAPAPARPAAGSRLEVLAIGVSTGGPNALSVLLPALHPHLAVPVVIVQHMPPLFTRLLAERITAVSPFTAREGAAGERLRPGQVWIAPGGLHLEVERTAEGVRLATHEGPPENSCRPAVDVLFRSVARVFGARALAVVLTGMGQDGLRGCAALREAGGRILVQDEASSVVWGMPGAVAHAGLAEMVLPLPELARAINRLLPAGPPAAGPADPRVTAPARRAG